MAKKTKKTTEEVNNQTEIELHSKKSESMILGPTNPDELRDLQEDTPLYTCEYEFKDGEGKVDVKKFMFKRYEKELKHIDVEKDVGVIPAILYIEGAPSVEIKQDIGTCFYKTGYEAVKSFRDSIELILSDCDKWLESNPVNV